MGSWLFDGEVGDVVCVQTVEVNHVRFEAFDGQILLAEMLVDVSLNAYQLRLRQEGVDAVCAAPY